MALKPCRECGTEVSTEAKKCPHCGVKNPTRVSGRQEVNKGAYLLVGFLLFVVWMVISSGGDTSSSSTARSAGASASFEEKLAVIDAGGYDGVSQTVVSRYRAELNGADRVCPENRQKIADMVVVASRQAEEKTGRVFTTLEMLEGINTALAGEAATLGVSCAETLAAIVVLVE